MICPKCRLQYDDEQINCSKCGVRLINGPDTHGGEHPFNDSVDLFIPVLDTYNAMDIAFIKSLLDDTGVDYFFHGEFFNAVHPAAQPARLMVRRDQAEEAMELIRELKLHYISASPLDDEALHEDEDTSDEEQD